MWLTDFGKPWCTFLTQALSLFWERAVISLRSGDVVIPWIEWIILKGSKKSFPVVTCFLESWLLHLQARGCHSAEQMDKSTKPLADGPLQVSNEHRLQNRIKILSPCTWRTGRTGSYRSDPQGGLVALNGDTSMIFQPPSGYQKVGRVTLGDYQSKSFTSKLACLFSHSLVLLTTHGMVGMVLCILPPQRFFPKQFLIKMHFGCFLCLFV